MGVPWMGGDSKMVVLNMYNLHIGFAVLAFLVFYSFPGYVHP